MAAAFCLFAATLAACQTNTPAQTLTEQDAGNARAALASARMAEKTAKTPAAQSAARSIVMTVSPYERVAGR